MNTAYILHGVPGEEEYFQMNFPSPSNAHWLPWLQQKFLRAGMICQCLEMPTPYKPNYAEWKNVWQHAQLSDSSVVVGHSAGCGFILKWLSENPSVRLAKIALVAPWFDPRCEMGDFLRFELDAQIQERVTEIHVFYADNEDVDGVAETKEKILSTFSKAKLHKFPTHGHFCLGDMGTSEFPELWDVVK